MWQKNENRQTENRKQTEKPITEATLIQMDRRVERANNMANFDVSQVEYLSAKDDQILYKIQVPIVSDISEEEESEVDWSMV